MRCPIKTPNENSLSIIAWSTNVKSKYKVASIYICPLSKSNLVFSANQKTTPTSNSVRHKI